MFKRNLLKIFCLFLTVSSISIKANENYSCIEDDYVHKECKFEMPNLSHGETKLINTKSGIFEGNLLVLCNNGKRTIVSESCNYVQGEADACKGIPENNWTGMNDSMCQHKQVNVAVGNGEDYKVKASTGSGFINYSCEDSELKVKSTLCERADKPLYTTKSVGLNCQSLSFISPADLDHNTDNMVGVAPTDNFCINQGLDYLDSYALLSDQLELNTTKIGRYDAICCQNDTLASPSQEMVVSPINSDCADVTGIIQGSYNDITGVYDNKPSHEQILNNFCKPNGYNLLNNYSSSNVVAGSYTYTDEFNVSAYCCGNNAIADNNTECKGAFISSGNGAETEAKALGVPYICDSSGGLTECYMNSCTPFVKDAELCAECDLGDYTFNANFNTCTTNFPVILTGHDNTQTFYNDTHSGYADVSCNNGQEAVEDARCFRNCLDKRVTWENEKGTAVCYQDLSDSKYRHYLQPTDNDRTNPNMEIGDKTGRLDSITHTGIAEFHCDDGTWEQNSEDLAQQYCYADCSSGVVSWGTGYSKDGRDKTNACRSNVSQKRHYLQPDINTGFGIDPMANASTDPSTNVSTGSALGLHVGSTSFRCNDGSWELDPVVGTPTCNLDCEAQRVTWTVAGVSTYADVGATKHGQSLNNVHGQTVNTGQNSTNRSLSSIADFTCNDGRYIQKSTSTAWKDCPASSMVVDSPNYANSCTISWGMKRHGDSGSLSVGGNGTGSATFSCVNGEMNVKDIVCNRSCPSDTLDWARSTGASAGCPSGFVNNSGTCEKTNIVNPTCPSGFSYVNSTDQCEKSTSVTDTYDAVPECKGDYSDYDEDGYNCTKEYSVLPTCPPNYIFDGTECVSTGVSTASTGTETWACDAGYTFHATYTNSESTGTNCTETNVIGTATESCASYQTLITSSSDCQSGGINAAKCCLQVEVEDLWCRKESRYRNDCKNIFEIYTPTKKTCSSGTVSGSQCVEEKFVACPTNDTDYTNVCVKETFVEPSCSSGYSFNTSSGLCESTSLVDANVSCSRGDGELKTCNQIYGITKRSYLVDSCLDFGVNGQACFGSEYNCKDYDDSQRRICDWFVLPPDASCPSGGSLNRSTGKCTVTNKKAGSCASGQELVGSSCQSIEILDATNTCADGTAPPCDPVPQASTCDNINLDDGTVVTPKLDNGLCKYFHEKVNEAEETCPTGGTSTSRVCYVNDTATEVETPDCSNGGTINASTNKCVATVTVPAESSDPVYCEDSVSGGSHGTNRSLSDTITNLATGSGSTRCVDGNWVIATSSTCYKDCNTSITSSTNSNGTMSWETGESLASDHPAYGMKCSTGTISMSGDYGHGATTTKNTTDSGVILQGEITYTCNDGFWDSSGESCKRVACAATSKTFTGASSCDVSVGSMAWGDTKTINQPVGFSGDTDAIYLCGDSGATGLDNSPDCNADCNVSSATLTGSWTDNTVNSCAKTYTNYITHNKSISIEDSSGSDRGSATVSCNNGTLTTTNIECLEYIAKGTSVSWSSGNCSGTTAGTISDGGSVGGSDCTTSTDNSGSGSGTYRGTTDICATTTGWSASSSICNEGCDSTSKSWSNCSGSTGIGYHGYTATLSDGASGAWEGSATATCNNGSWSVSGGSCSSTCDTSEFNPNQCPSGYTYKSSSKKCEKSNGNKWTNTSTNSNYVCGTPVNDSPPSGSCTVGETYDYGFHICINYCKYGNKYNSIEICRGEPNSYIPLKSTCVESTETTSPTCPSGYTLQGNGKCIADCAYSAPDPDPVGNSCSSQRLTWGACSDSTGTASDGNSVNLSFAARKAGGQIMVSGNARATCNNGSWSISNTYCEAEDLCGRSNDMQECK